MRVPRACSTCNRREFAGLRSPSLSSLVSILLDVRLDKSEQLTDWSTPPYAGGAGYAASDVVHLLPLAVALRHRLEDLGARRGRPECERLRTADLRRPEPDTVVEDQGRDRSARQKAQIAQANTWRDARSRKTCAALCSPSSRFAVVGRPPRTVDDVLALRGVRVCQRDRGIGRGSRWAHDGPEPLRRR